MAGHLFIASERWKSDHAGSKAALVLYRNMAGNTDTPALTEMKRALEVSLTDRWQNASKQELLQDPTLAAYERYDRQFGQSYHVTMQIRSIAQKGKTIPARNAIVEAMFMTEPATGVLAAAQDVDQLSLPITIDSTDGSEQYTRYDGATEHCKAGDQVMKDASGTILTSIAQGPTSAGMVGPTTTSVAYCFYFPAGVTETVIGDALAYLDKCVVAASPHATRAEIVMVSANQT